MITINSQLDMTPGAIPVVIHRSQYDSDFSIVFTLFARTGNFTIASGTTAKVRGTKKSGTGYSADATIDVSAKTVTVTGDQQMTVASGQNIFEIVLLSGTKELCSANFILDVERAALDVDTITDDTVARELDNLDQFVSEAQSAATRAETAESNITTLQSNKVDKTTPLLNFDDTATDPLTDDGALANALKALDILDEVTPSGGGMLYLKKALTELCERVTTTRGEITMASGFAATVKYVKRQGDLVYLDFRLDTGAPGTETWTVLGTVPEGFRSSTKLVPMGYDNDYSKPCAFRIDTDGTLSVWRTSANGPHAFLSTTYLV